MADTVKIKSPRQEVKDQYQEEKLKLKNDINEKINNTPNAFDILLEQIKNQINSIITNFEETYHDQIQIIKYTCNDGIRIFNKLNNPDISNNDRELLENKFKLFLETLTDSVKEMFFMVIEILHLKEILEIFKSIYTASVSTIKYIISALKNADDLSDKNMDINNSINDLWKKIKNTVKSLLPLLDKLLLLVGIYLANLLSYKDLGQNNLNNELNNLDKNINTNDSSIKINNNFYNIDDNDNLQSTNSDDSSLISICPIPTESSDINSLFNNNGIPNKAYIEIDKSNQFNFNVSLNQDVSTNTILGYINGLPIKSHISGKIVDIHDNYIEIDNYVEFNVGFENVNKIVENFESLNNLEDFLRDYSVETLLPKITNNKLSKKTNLWLLKNLELKLNVDIYNNVIDNKNKLIDSYYNDIKNINNESSITSLCENDNTDQYLYDVLNIKKNFYKNLFDLYNNNYECSQTLLNNSDYKLYTYYLNIYSNLDSSTSNKYILNFKTILNNILLTRFTADNINIYDLINQINKICNETFNNKNNYNYYNDLNNKFKDSNFDYDSIFNYLNSLNTNNNENITNNINTVINLFEFIKNIYKNNLINDSNNKTIKYTEDQLIELTKSEIKELNSFISNLINEYYDLYDKCYNYDYNDEIKWPACSTIINNNMLYSYYLFNPNKTTNNYDNASEKFSGTTNIETDNIKYWKKYCSLATLLSIPYLSTGLIIAGTPVLLPIVYVPITVIKLKAMIIVIGLGICGIAIYPMTLYVNTSAEYATIVVATMMALDAIKQSFENDLNNENNSITLIANNLIKQLNNDNDNIDLQIKEINKQIDELKNTSLSDVKNKIKEMKKESKRSKGIRLKNK